VRDRDIGQNRSPLPPAMINANSDDMERRIYDRMRMDFYQDSARLKKGLYPVGRRAIMTGQ
jgi:hypothetical protein